MAELNELFAGQEDILAEQTNKTRKVMNELEHTDFDPLPSDEQTTESVEVAENEEEEEETDDTTETADEESSEETKKEDTKLNPYEEVIFAEMTKRAENGDELLATALQSADKSIKGCYSYVVAQARKQAQGNCAMVDDQTVYGWAHHYYIESKETIEQEIPAMKPYVAPKPAPKTAEQKKQEEQTKKVYANPLLAALMKKGGKIATDGTIAVTKTTERKDKDGNLLFSKAVKTDAQGTKTTTIEKGGKTYTMTEFSLF